MFQKLSEKNNLPKFDLCHLSLSLPKNVDVQFLLEMMGPTESVQRGCAFGNAANDAPS